MNAEAILAIIQGLRLANQLATQWQSGQLSDEDFLKRYREVNVPLLKRIDERWEAAGEPKK